MNKSEMHSQLKALRADADKALSGGKMRAALLVPKILDDLFGLVESIINRLPEDPYAQA